MTASTVVDSGMPAHGLHDAMVLLGLWGLAALLLPHLIERHRTHQAARSGDVVSYVPDAGGHLDEHARRVCELRLAVATGTLAAPRPRDPGGGATGHGPDPSRTTPAAAAAPLGLPLALVAGTAAAGIHAAVVLPHLAEEPLFGVFFALVAGAQLWWVSAVAGSPTPTVLWAGVVGNVALIGLWLTTRIVGLPFGLLPEPHPLGGWDLACVAWQVLVIASCARVLRDGIPSRIPGWSAWHPSTRAAVGAATVVMLLLTVVGAHS